MTQVCLCARAGKAFFKIRETKNGTVRLCALPDSEYGYQRAPTKLGAKQPSFQGSAGNPGAEGCVEWLPPPALDGTKPTPLPLQPYIWAPFTGSCDNVDEDLAIQGVPLSRKQGVRAYSAH